MDRAVKATVKALEAGRDVLLCCEHTPEGVMSAVALSYYAKADAQRLRVESRGTAQPRLTEEVVEVQTDGELAVRVYEGFEKRCAKDCSAARNGRCHGGCSGACARRIAYAAASDDPSMPDVVFRYMRLGFSVGARIRDMLSDPVVAPLADMARSVSSECEKTRQFVRFSHLADGSYMASFSPKADTIPLTAGYFRARLANERFCVIDPVHMVGAFYDQRLEIVRLDTRACRALIAHAELAQDEIYVRAMWKLFYDKLALPGRDKSQRGYDLRMHFMPKRLWGGLPEFDPGLDTPPEAPAHYRGDGGSTTLDSSLPGASATGFLESA